LIVGGGVIGLSLAWELAGRARTVCVIDRQQPGREASWAGAGILPPAVYDAASPPYEQLTALSHELHAAWAAELRESTGIDNGYRRCGGVYVAHDAATESSLRDAMDAYRAQGVEVEELNAAQLCAIEPSLTPPLVAFRLPDECQIRNPWHLRALTAACVARGVEIRASVEAEDFVLRGERLDGVRTSTGVLQAAQYCVASGPWTRALLTRLGQSLGIRPVRGQMALLRTSPTALRHVVNQGARYLVPRGDGLVLIGSTQEEAGFERRTTADGIAGLLDLASRLAPVLRDAELVQSWAGLRPGTFDGLPYLGRVPALSNAFVAAGHFRSGLHLSTGTARVMSQLICEQMPEIDLTPFRLGRSG
jgi:glycine oxidase